MAYQNHFVLAVLVLVSSQALHRGDANLEDSTSVKLNDDVLGLMVFKSDLHDPENTLSSWNEDDNSPCSWSFIRCDPSTGRVSEISIDGIGLSGKLGRGLKELQSLEVLSVSRNNLSGNIGVELPQLLPSSLKRLNLSHNRFSGQLNPTSLGALRVLDLSENLIFGPIPDSVFRGCSLHYLSLGGNSFEGTLPRTLSKCSDLNGLNLSSNRLTGNPFRSSGIWSLSRIRVLDLSSNGFSGIVPVGMMALHNMKELHLQGNRFSGPIPFDLGFCPHLNRIDLSENRFNGAIPESLRMITNSVTHLDLSSNMLIGRLPHWIENMTSLESLDLSKNGLKGSLPVSIGNLRSLQSLSLSDNNLRGFIPASLASCNQLTRLQLRGNAFGGSIPESVFSMGLEQLDLSWNRLEGCIPPGSSRLFESLLALDLSGNNLRGNIPPEMGLFTNLGYLNLSWNNLDSMIPPELGYLQKLTVLDLRNSALYGSVPGDLCESGSLSVLQLDGNSLSGHIPPEIGNCSSLHLLSLSHNNLGGVIPTTMAMLKKLEILRLEFNQLTGEIPSELGALRILLAVNLSHNRLIGRLPRGGIFPSLDPSVLEGNSGICSPRLRGPCKMDVPKPLVLDPYAYPNQIRGHGGDGAATARVHRRRFLSLSAIITMAAALTIVAGVVLISLLNASARRKLEIVDHKVLETESVFSASSRSITGGSPSMGRLVLFDSNPSGEWITNPESLFDKASEIGGDVYKAALDSSGGDVAIKILPKANILEHPEDFDREVRLLGRVRHNNLVALRGYYWTPQLQLLVSDYVSNGSLQTELHERPPLSWANRFKIMLGTAKALAYLHHSCNPPIIHYNLKPSNVLLDATYNVKISDFGLLRLQAKADRTIMSHRFRSAVGYMAPELACQGLRINEKCDVYGFGVMALELVTCRRTMEYGEDMLGCVDESMGEYPDEEVLPVLKLALVCTSQTPSSRPSMAEVLQILQVIKTPIPSRIEAY